MGIAHTNWIGVQAGAIFVDFEAERYLRRTLAQAGLPKSDVDEYTKAGVQEFEAHAKRTFHDKTAECYVVIAHSRFNNNSIGTRRGRMSLPGWVEYDVIPRILY